MSIGSRPIARHRRQAVWSLLSAAVLMAAGGAGCPHLVDQYALTTSPALPPAATMDEVVQLVNRNSFAVERLATTNATISSPGIPTLRARLAYERPRRLRLTAQTALLGPEIDLGSNDEYFWMWIQRSQPPSMYFCRHDQFAESNARHALPIEPDWIIEALGIVRFDPRDEHQGPYHQPGGRIEVRSLHRTASGVTTKVVQIDAAQGAVVQQDRYDEQGRLIASSRAGKHRRDPLTDVVLPREVEIHWPFAQVTLKIDMGDLDINGPAEGSEDRWVMPQYSGAQLVDLADPRLQFAPLEPPASPDPAQRSGHQQVVRKPPLEWIYGILRR